MDGPNADGTPDYRPLCHLRHLSRLGAVATVETAIRWQPMVQSTTNTTIPVATGPAGRAMAQPMDGALLEGLQQHLTMERQASAAYWAMAIWLASPLR